jgi:hypothetical protein
VDEEVEGVHKVAAPAYFNKKIIIIFCYNI